MPAFLRAGFGNAYLILPAASLMWAGNSIIGRLAIGEVTPMTLTCLRWLFVCAMMGLLFRDRARDALPVLAPRWLWVILMAALGYTAFNALLYVAAHHTSGISLTMLQASIPVFVLAGASLIFRSPVGWLQGLGTLLTLVGVAIVASKGDISQLLALRFNIGDVYVLVASALYAGYTLGLRKRPPVDGLGMFIWFATVALVVSLPLLAWEVAQGTFFWPSAKGWAILAYAVIGPSFLCQVFYIRGVELIGPARAGLFINLIPVFGALMAVAILGEPFGWSEVIAAVLVFGGIGLSEAARR